MRKALRKDAQGQILVVLLSLSGVVAADDNPQTAQPAASPQVAPAFPKGVRRVLIVCDQDQDAFVIAVGSYVKSLTSAALETAEKIGPVTAHLGNNDCGIPFAPDYIRKVQQRGAIGKKRKTAKC